MRHLIPILLCSFLTIEGFSQHFQKSVSSSELTLSLDSVAADIGDTVQISLRGFGFMDIYALYGTLQYDSTSLELISYTQDSLVGNLLVNQDTAGQIPFSWLSTNPYGVTFPDSSSLFSMDFKVLGLTEGTALTFTNSPTQLEYWSDFTPFGGWDIYIPDTISGQVSLLAAPVGMAEQPEQNLSIYPNPTSGQVQLDFGKTVNGVTLQVINVLGAVAYSIQLNELQHYNLELPKAKGIYFVQILGNERSVERHTVVKE